MTLRAWEVAGLARDYWEKHALDIRVRLAAAPYLRGWRYRLSSPRMAYALPDAMGFDLQAKDGDRFTNCSTMTVSLLTSIFPSAPWSREEYGDLQVFKGKQPDSPIRAVVRMGVGEAVDTLVDGSWHLVQGWRRLGESPSGHAFLVLKKGDVVTVLEASSRENNVGPRYRETTVSRLRGEYPAAFLIAELNR